MQTTNETPMAERNADDVRAEVREHYGKVAETNGAVGCAPSCCAPSGGDASLALGYTKDELAAVPEGSNLGLGCGNPQTIASLRAGETVLDLGSGAGFDCFLAARAVGPSGKVLGVDMTPAMLTKARGNAAKVGASNVEFRLGEIEHLPIGDAEVDVVMSNCVVNLSPDKAAVYREAFRVLRPGGRVAISDVVALAPIPDALRATTMALSACVAGAAHVDGVRAMLTTAGFEDVAVDVARESRAFIEGWLPGSRAEDYVASASITARKPGGTPRPVMTNGAETKADAAPAAKACCGPTCCT